MRLTAARPRARTSEAPYEGRARLSPRSCEHLFSADKTLLPRAGEVHAHPGTPWAAELPTARVETRGLVEVIGLCGLDAVGEGDRRPPRARIAEPDLAARLEVVDVGVESRRIGAAHQLGEVRHAALLHRRLDVGPRLPVGRALAPALLGQEDVALGAQACQLLLDGTHAALDAGDAALELLGLESGQVLRHGGRR